MWHDVVSTLDRAADAALSQALSTYLQHPVAASGFLLALLLIAGLLFTRGKDEQVPDRDEDRVIRIRR